MLNKLRFAKRLFRDLPRHGKLAYCLLRDERVPAVYKAAFGAALAVGVNPFFNLPEFIPVVGELDALAVTLLALRVFIAAAPGDIVEEHRELVAAGQSTFDDDLHAGEHRLAQIIDGLADRVDRVFGHPSSDDDATREHIELSGSTSATTNERQVSA